MQVHDIYQIPIFYVWFDYRIERFGISQNIDQNERKMYSTLDQLFLIIHGLCIIQSTYP